MQWIFLVVLFLFIFCALIPMPFQWVKRLQCVACLLFAKWFGRLFEWHSCPSFFTLSSHSVYTGSSVSLLTWCFQLFYELCWVCLQKMTCSFINCYCSNQIIFWGFSATLPFLLHSQSLKCILAMKGKF